MYSECKISVCLHRGILQFTPLHALGSNDFLEDARIVLDTGDTLFFRLVAVMGGVPCVRTLPEGDVDVLEVPVADTTCFCADGFQ